MFGFLSLNSLMESMGADNVGELIGMVLGEFLLIFVIVYVIVKIRNIIKRKKGK